MHEELEQFAGGFFNEDYQLDYATPDDAIRDFAPEQGADAVRRLLGELDQLLESPLSDDQMYDLWINKLYANYDPRDDGLTYREWFAHVRELLTQAKAD